MGMFPTLQARCTHVFPDYGCWHDERRIAYNIDKIEINVTMTMEEVQQMNILLQNGLMKKVLFKLIRYIH